MKKHIFITLIIFSCFHSFSSAYAYVPNQYDGTYYTDEEFRIDMKNYLDTQQRRQQEEDWRREDQEIRDSFYNNRNLDGFIYENEREQYIRNQLDILERSEKETLELERLLQEQNDIMLERSYGEEAPSYPIFPGETISKADNPTRPSFVDEWKDKDIKQAPTQKTTKSSGRPSFVDEWANYKETEDYIEPVEIEASESSISHTNRFVNSIKKIFSFNLFTLFI